MMDFKIVIVLLTLVGAGYASRTYNSFNPCKIKFWCGIGSCEPSEDFKNFTWYCQHGFNGRFCEIKKAPSCSERQVPCQKNGKCHDILNGIVCECPKGTYGRRCEILDEKALPNWGILTLEDPISHITNVSKEYKLIGTVTVNKVGTLKAFKERLGGLINESTLRCS
ncbi:unnamed protein product [Bursaphelenchus okinawaensis]|uniref:EGF-like domain-containing protein n=1 Tax=Bursaphelenchus okinawaensis TaxID=465554 RepID=A0A811K4D6_9BILA|nr:unnamed protein product [Bursaphelenchus okinawaensis]CAG9091157.1 unnamed protein product [Bursaphelenchus okinawaensis]